MPRAVGYGGGTAALEPLPPEQAMNREEEAILWRSLERMPEIYREPLVLFYRKHHPSRRWRRVWN